MTQLHCVRKMLFKLCLAISVLVFILPQNILGKTSDRGIVSIKIKETKKNGVTVIVRGRLAATDTQAAYNLDLDVLSEGVNIEKSCSVSPQAPLIEESSAGVDKLRCELDPVKGDVVVLYKLFNQNYDFQYQGIVEIRKGNTVLVSGEGSVLLSDPSTPTIPPTSSVKIIAIGDSGEGNPTQLAVAQAMSQKCLDVGGCTAVIMAGNIIFDNGVNSADDPQWADKFEFPYDQPGLNGLRFYAVPGINDYSAFGTGSTGSLQAMIDYSNLPVGGGPGTRLSDKFTMPNKFYDFLLGSGLVHFFGIDTQVTAGGSPTDQPDDMANRVANSTAPWKISFGNFPRFSSGDSQDDLPILDTFFPPPGIFALQEAVYCGTDLYIAGRDSHREFIDKGQDPNCPNTHFAISAAASKTTASALPSVANQLFFDDTTPGFAYLEFEQNTMLFEFYDQDGNLSYSKTITKTPSP